MCVRYPIDPKCLLGRGAFGVVYATRGRKGNAEYALKRYNDVLAENAGTDLILSCIREIFILQQLPEHPSIIRLRDVVVTHNTVDLVLDKALTNLNVSLSTYHHRSTSVLTTGLVWFGVVAARRHRGFYGGRSMGDKSSPKTTSPRSSTRSSRVCVICTATASSIET